MKPPAPDLPSAAPSWPVLLASIATIAATYIYFLIFAEFAFLEFAAASLTPAQMEPLMGALGSGGVAGSLLAAARLIRRLGGEIVTCLCLVELEGLGGRERLEAEGLRVDSVVRY